MFSKACEYGIRATLYIAMKSLQAQRVSLRDIAREIDSPVAFTAKILQQLTRNHIIDSMKGVSGGFEIHPDKIDAIKLSRIISAIDGDSVYKGCGLGLHECSELYPCPFHEKFKIIREELKDMLESTSVLDLSRRLEMGLTFLKRETDIYRTAETI